MIAGAIIALSGSKQGALAAIQACPNAADCVEVKVDVGTTTVVKAGDTFDANLTFKQGASNGQPGGIDESAALALTLRLGTTGTPLTLATCTLDGDGFPSADVVADPMISNFKVVVENANCANGKTHCLCPTDAGQTRDNFINFVIYGPNPLPTPGPSAIDIPILPAGPQTLVTFHLKVDSSAGAGVVPLHIINQVVDDSRPQFTAFLSVGDKLAVDQTCVPVTGQPPCSSAQSVSQVEIKDASVQVKAACVGDCDNSNSVAVNEVIIMTNIALGTDQPSSCPAGDPGNDGVQINDIVTAVNNALHGCS
jgi:hypothetical protein